MVFDMWTSTDYDNDSNSTLNLTFYKKSQFKFWRTLAWYLYRDKNAFKTMKT